MAVRDPLPTPAMDAGSNGEPMELMTENQQSERMIARAQRAIYELEVAFAELRRLHRVKELREKGRAAFEEANRLEQNGPSGNTRSL